MLINLEKAKDLLLAGQVVAVPTETVYGLAASLASPSAIQSLYTLKGRPKQNPLIVHVASREEAESYAEILPMHFSRLAETFWPGPVTFILPAKGDRVPEMARAGLPTAAFRMPNHPLTLQLLKETGPLVMPSANISGRPSATSPEHVLADFGPKFPVLDGGPCLRGVESTILGEHEGRWQILRLGAISADAFEPILGYTPQLTPVRKGEAPICPGQLFRHYAPEARLIPTTQFAADMKGAVLGFADRTYPSGCKLYSLGSIQDPHSVAENLYAALRSLDHEEVKEAFVDMNFPRHQLWETIAERLLKASRSS